MEMKKSVYIIAEAGVNHNGSMALARQLINVAVDAGADAVKFQSFVADKEISSGAAKAAYQLKTTDRNISKKQTPKLTRMLISSLLCKEK